MGFCLGSLPFVFLNDMFFTLFFLFFGDFCVCVCDFERKKYKSKIFVLVLGFVFVILKGKIKNLKFFVFELGVLVATLVWLKNMILGFFVFGFLF